MNKFRYKFEPDVLKTFSVILVLKLKIVYKECMAISAFAKQPIFQFLKTNISFNIIPKELRLSVIIHFHTLLSLPRLICI